ncbi:MAG: hypothetical protein QXZ09_08420 [Candidatus Methanomethylicaceae archaeon]
MPRETLLLGPFRGVARNRRKSRLDPSELFDAIGFVVTDDGWLMTEGRFFPVPAYGLPEATSATDYTIRLIAGDRSTVADGTQVKGLLYLVLYECSVDAQGNRTPQKTIIYKTFKQTASTAGVYWRQAHGATPPWGSSPLTNHLDIAGLNGRVYFASGDPANGGLFVDQATGNATDTSQFSSRINLSNNSIWRPHILAVFGERLFAGELNRLRWTTMPGEGYSSSHWLANENYIDIGQGQSEGGSIFGLVPLGNIMYIVNNAGIWVLDDPDPGIWQLQQVRRFGTETPRAIAVDPRGAVAYMLDSMNRVWMMQEAGVTEISEAQDRLRYAMDSSTGAVGVSGDWLYISAMPPSPATRNNPENQWKREGRPSDGAQPEGNAPWIVNLKTFAATRSRALVGWRGAIPNLPYAEPSAFIDPGYSRLYIAGGQTYPCLPAQARAMVYTDPTLEGVGFDQVNVGEPYYALPGPTSDTDAHWVIFAELDFGRPLALKKIHQIRVRLAPTYAPWAYQPPAAFPTVEFYHRSLTPRGWTGWLPMYRLEDYHDPASWTNDTAIPCDDRFHGVSLRPADPADASLADAFDYDVYSFQLKLVYRGTNPPNGIIVKAIGIDYEVVEGII